MKADTPQASDNLGILGAGNMAEALTRGLIRSGLVPAAHIVAGDPSAARRDVFAKLGAAVSDDNRRAASCATVLLSVKPQMLDAVLHGAAEAMSQRTLLVSIAAGVKTARLAKLVPPGVRIVRVMPNTPMLAGAGVAGVAKGPNCTGEDLAKVLAWFRAAGTAEELDERLLDAVTALSGSGPAYVFRFVEALAAAGEAAGLPADLAMSLARGTLIGSAKLLAESPETAATLRERVTSPGGTTAAALRVFEEKQWAATVTDAVEAARRRSVELSGD